MQVTLQLIQVRFDLEEKDIHDFLVHEPSKDGY